MRSGASRSVLSDDRTADALLDTADRPILRSPHRARLERARELRSHLTIAEAVDVALAELLGAPLRTCDEHLARAGGHAATIERV